MQDLRHELSALLAPGGLKNIHRIDLAHRAMAHGENVMSEILSNEEIIGPAQLSGDLDEDFSYSAEVADFEDSDQSLALPNVAAPNIHLLSVQVRIMFKNDKHGKYYQISSLKAVSLMAMEGDLQGLSGDPIRRLFGRGTQ